MPNLRNLPEHCKHERPALEIHGTVNDPGGLNHGKPAIVRMYESYESMGYKTNYTQVKTRYIRVTVNGKEYVTRFSGSRYAKALDDIEDMKSFLIVDVPEPEPPPEPEHQPEPFVMVDTGEDCPQYTFMPAPDQQLSLL